MVELTQLGHYRCHKLRIMKKMKQTIYGIVLMMVMSGSAFGQTIDQKRMDRDLEIAENILQTLSNMNGKNIFYSHNDTESSYIPDYGVIFSLPSNSFKIRTKSNLTEYVISGTSGNNNTVVVAPQATEGSSYSYSYSSSDEDSSDKGKMKSEEKAKIKEKLKVESENFEKENEEMFKEQATAFLVDYADLIGQLKTTDKIMVNSKSKNNHILWIGDNHNNRQSTSRSAEITKSDLIAYKQGKASREATIKKVKFSSSVKDEKVERDLEMFGSIFAKLYDSQLSNTYYTSNSRVNYDKLENFGAIYNMRVYSSSENNGLHTIRTTGENSLTREQRNNKVNAMYPEFEKSVKENLVDYGRTIRSLGANEMLMMKIRLTECKGCEMPKSIEVSVKASVLNDFNSGKMNRDAAIKAVTLKKINN